MILLAYGVEPVMVADGREAVAVIRRVRPECVILDLRMPDIDGWDVARALRADNELKRIPIIVLTSSWGAQDRATAHEVGVEHYLCKPFDVLRLAQAIEKATGQALVFNEQRVVACQQESKA